MTDLGTARYRLERRVLGIGAIGVIVAFSIENVVRGHLLNRADVVEWWQYATPVFAAFFCLTALPRSVVRRIRDLVAEAGLADADSDDVIDVLRVVWQERTITPTRSEVPD
ncbi:MAG TPA: hypothetical protein VEX88_14790 [Glaciibacter sp.]|nr:hypothetical protein [Glaciibacter sp.]